MSPVILENSTDSEVAHIFEFQGMASGKEPLLHVMI